jgi:hypothetical protein
MEKKSSGNFIFLNFKIWTPPVFFGKILNIEREREGGEGEGERGTDTEISGFSKSFKQTIL